MALAIVTLSPIVSARVMDFESHRPESQNSPDDSPEQNPVPHATVTIQGEKDPRIELWFIVTYSTTNDACRARSLPMVLSGAPKIPQTIYDSVRVPAGESHFSVHIYLDRYGPGRCGWAPIIVNRAAFLPDEARGPGAMTGLMLVRDNGIGHLSFSLRCRRFSNIAGAEPSLFLECRGVGRPGRDGDELSAGGGIVDVDAQLVPGPPIPAVSPKPETNWPPVEHGA
jgi:hypothetical protein